MTIGNIVNMHTLMFVWSCCGPVGNLALNVFSNISLVMLLLFEILFICIHLCSFGHAVALLGLLLYTHALMFIWSCFGPVLAPLGVLLYTHVLMFVWSCCGSIGSLALCECTYVHLVLPALALFCLYWECCFIHMHVCSFGHA